MLQTLINLVNSTQILIFPLAFGAMTIPEHQPVSCSTFSITPSCCILFNSVLTFGMRGMAIRLGVVKACGWQSLCGLMV